MKPNQLKSAAAVCVAALSLLVAACQTKTNFIQDPAAKSLEFDIGGKLSVTYTEPKTKEVKRASAFYGWGQRGGYYALDISGALGLGFTKISGGPGYATMQSEQIGVKSSESAEALLYEATGWRAPLSSLPFWVMAKADPQASNVKRDQAGRVVSLESDQWQAELNYRNDETLPFLIKAGQIGSSNAVAISIQSHQ